MTESIKTMRVAIPAIRILRLNIDKSRKGGGNPSTYKVFFKLSITPDAIWERVFGSEWKAFNVEKQLSLSDAAFEKDFLVVESSLQDIASLYLPNLTIAVARTNDTYVRQMETENAAGLNDETQEPLHL